MLQQKLTSLSYLTDKTAWRFFPQHVFICARQRYNNNMYHILLFAFYCSMFKCWTLLWRLFMLSYWLKVMVGGGKRFTWSLFLHERKLGLSFLPLSNLLLIFGHTNERLSAVVTVDTVCRLNILNKKIIFKWHQSPPADILCEKPRKIFGCRHRQSQCQKLCPSCLLVYTDIAYNFCPLFLLY